MEKLNIQLFAEGEATEEVVEQEAQEQTPDAGGEKKLSQTEVDEIVKTRLSRERETIAKTLGLDKFDKETIKGLSQQFSELRTQNEALQGQVETVKSEYENKLSTAQSEVLKYKYSIKEDRYGDALVLAQKRAASGEISLDEAMGKVVSEFPNLKGASLKGGIEAGNVSNPPENKFVSEDLKKKYPFLKQ